MTRNRVRQSFTVEAKFNGRQGRVLIPTKTPKQPLEPSRLARTEAGWKALSFAADVFMPRGERVMETRRILPSLIVRDVPQLERETTPSVELPPQSVRRAMPLQASDEQPRRRGRPRKVGAVAEAGLAAPLQPAAPTPDVVPPPEAVAVLPAAFLRRKERAGIGRLGRGERWKRRLPQSCW